MLSYQHIYHAGNVVDCQKHMVLSALLGRLCAAPAPFCYIETHAGRGFYNLQTAEAQKIREYRDGIARIWPLANWPIEAASYRDLLHRLNPHGGFWRYPGSPLIAAEHLRRQDFAMLYELHPQEHAALADNMRGYDNVTVVAGDGWQALQIPPPCGQRAMIFIDPSYELKNDYINLPKGVEVALTRWPESIFAVWYPMLAARRHHDMLDGFRNSGIRGVIRNEILIKEPDAGGLFGTGLLVINPPDGFEGTLAKIGDWLAASIGIDNRTDWIKTR